MFPFLAKTKVSTRAGYEDPQTMRQVFFFYAVMDEDEQKTKKGIHFGLRLYLKRSHFKSKV